MVSSPLSLVNVSTTVPITQPSTPNPDPPQGISPLRSPYPTEGKSPQHLVEGACNDSCAVHRFSDDCLAQNPLYQQVLNQLIEGAAPETTAQLLRTLALAAFDAGVAQGDRPPVPPARKSDPAPPDMMSPGVAPKTCSVSKVQESRGRSPTGRTAPLAAAENSEIASTVLTLETELREMEQCDPEAVGLWTAVPTAIPISPIPAPSPKATGFPSERSAPLNGVNGARKNSLENSPKNSPSNPSGNSADTYAKQPAHPSSSPTTVMSYASASGFPAPFANPFDMPELIGQILIDVPRKVAHPVVWESNPAPRPKAVEKNSRKVSKKRDKVTHHHHHFQMAANKTERSRYLSQSDRASQDKEFYDSDSAVFLRSAVPAIAPAPCPVRDQWESHLQTLGQYFRTERRRRGISLGTLSSRTYIPLHHLVSLESGSPEQLPQAIYVKGFIQRIAQDLGLNVNAIMADLPPLPAAAVVPSWLQNQSTSTSAIALRSWHLYLGYSAVLAGSLAWVAQDLQTSQMPVIEPTTQDSASQSDATSAELPDIDEDLSSLAPPEAIQP
ncbi:MAG: helix-turn-helix domain-containing protein [Cyanophyceae cyanobacterium]